jgi:hypothetical protein
MSVEPWETYLRANRQRPYAPPVEVYADPVLHALWYATAPRSRTEELLACALYDELTNMAMGHGVSLAGGGAEADDGRHVTAVRGAIDLVALARRAIAVLRDLNERDDARD